MVTQCYGITLQGTRCKHRTTNESNLCWQHHDANVVCGIIQLNPTDNSVVVGNPPVRNRQVPPGPTTEQLEARLNRLINNFIEVFFLIEW